MENHLIIPEFQPKTNLEEYTLRPRGSDGLAFFYLTEDWYWKKIFKPLPFFNLLYEQVGIAFQNRSNPVVLKQHLLNLKLEKPERLYLYKFLGEHIDDISRSNKFSSEPLDYENLRMLTDIRGMISKEYSPLFKELYENEDKNVDNPNNRFDYAREMKLLEAKPDKEAKQQYLTELLADYTSNVGTWEENKRWNGESFSGMITRERDKIKQEIESERQQDSQDIISEEPEPENDLLLSTIEDYLSEFESIIIVSDLETLSMALKQYFETGTFPVLSKIIKVGRVNIKRFGWVLNELYRSLKGNSKLSMEYLKFVKENISLFNEVEFDEDNKVNSTLYKYFTTQTPVK